MRQIYKYRIPVPILSKFSVTMPVGAQVVMVSLQDGVPQMWALVNPNNSLIEKTFYLLGTGWDVPGDAIHITSFLQDSYVWHVFEKVDS